MTLALFVLAALCAVNAPRSRAVLPTDGGDGWFGYAEDLEVTGRPVRLPVALGGAAIALIVLLPIAAFADPLLDLVDISPATARIATGLLLVVTGILLVGWPMPGPEPSLPGHRAALVPVAFPTLLTPGLALLALTASADHSALTALVVLAVTLATVPAIATIPVRPPGSAQHRVLDGSARAVAGLLVLAGFGLLFDGVFDV